MIPLMVRVQIRGLKQFYGKGIYTVSPQKYKQMFESQIGEVEEYTRYENEHPSLTKVWSNEYPLGTKIFKVKNELTKKAIGVEINGNS